MKSYKKTFFIRLLFFIFILFALIRTYRLFIPSDSRNSQNGKSIQGSRFFGQKVRIAPFLNLIKLDRWSNSWTDNYYYVIAGIPKLGISDVAKNIVSFEREEIFTVIDVKFKIASYLLSPRHDKLVCILQHSQKKDLIATIDCNSLVVVDEMAGIYSSVESGIKRDGSVLISMEKFGPSHLQQLYRVNTFFIHKLMSVKDLITLFFLNEDDTNPIPAESLMYRTLPFVINNENDLNERIFALLLKNSKFGNFLSSLELGGGSLRDEFLKNELPKDIEDWIALSFPESSERRWASRVLASFFYRHVLGQGIQNAISARENFALIDEVSTCLSKYFDSTKTSSMHFDKLKAKILENERLTRIFIEVKQLSQIPIKEDYKYYSGGCTEFSPPEKFHLP